MDVRTCGWSCECAGTGVGAEAAAAEQGAVAQQKPEPACLRTTPNPATVRVERQLVHAVAHIPVPSTRTPCVGHRVGVGGQAWRVGGSQGRSAPRAPVEMGTAQRMRLPAILCQCRRVNATCRMTCSGVDVTLHRAPDASRLQTRGCPHVGRRADVWVPARRTTCGRTGTRVDVTLHCTLHVRGPGWPCGRTRRHGRAGGPMDVALHMGDGADAWVVVQTWPSSEHSSRSSSQ